MDEFELINHYFKRESFSESVAIGIGDDCAVLELPDGHQLAVSIDTLLPKVHFFADADPALIGERSLSVAISDLAAMGAEPLCFTLALSLPSFDDAWLKGFSSGLAQAADHYECRLVGGDTTRGSLTISIQVHGTLPRGMAITRDGAKVGDLVCVSGPLGDGAAALAALKGEISVGSSAFRYFNNHYYRPQACITLGKQLRGLASAAIDISDGLVADLGHICRASGVGAELDLDTIPLSEPAHACGSKAQCRTWALSGGDDYQLCFTVPHEKTHAFSKFNQHFPDICVIGRITDGANIHCKETREDLSQHISGYKHFV